MPLFNNVCESHELTSISLASLYNELTSISLASLYHFHILCKNRLVTNTQKNSPIR